MTKLHKSLTAERWGQFSVCEQMANIGVEVGRAINWRNKGMGSTSALRQMCCGGSISIRSITWRDGVGEL